MVCIKVGSSHRITRGLLKTCVVHLLHSTEEEAEFRKCAVPILKVWSSSLSTHPKLLVRTQCCKWEKCVFTALHPPCHSCPCDGQSHPTCTPAFLCFSISTFSKTIGAHSDHLVSPGRRSLVEAPRDNSQLKGNWSHWTDVPTSYLVDGQFWKLFCRLQWSLRSWAPIA